MSGLPVPADGERIAVGIRRVRLERNLSVRDMAALLSVSASVVSRIESGQRVARIGADEIAARLGVTAGYLLEDCPRCSYQPPEGYMCLRCGTVAGR